MIWGKTQADFDSLEQRCRSAESKLQILQDKVQSLEQENSELKQIKVTSEIQWIKTDK